MLSAKLMSAVTQGMEEERRKVIKILGSHYGFSVEEGLAKIVGAPSSSGSSSSVTSKSGKVPKPTLVLPYTGVRREGCCGALRLNHGLFTQCVNGEGEGGYCKTCEKQVTRTGAPTYGTIEDRLKCGLMEYRAPSGKQVVPFANVMSKLGISREEAEEEAGRLGLTIPEEQFVERKASRGRPKKATMTTDTDSEAGTPKKRGRPKKEKKVVESSAGDDLIAQLVAAASANSESSSNESSEESSDEESGGEDGDAKQAEAKKAEKEAEKAAAKQAKEAKKAEREAKKVAREAKKAEREAKKAERELKKAEKEAEKAEKAEKKAEKEKEKAEKKAKKEAAAADKAEKKALKEAAEKKAKEEAMDGFVKEAQELEEGAQELEEEEEEEVSVTKFSHQGKSYLRDGDDILYDATSQEPVGKWNAETETVDDLPAGFDEESDDEC